MALNTFVWRPTYPVKNNRKPNFDTVAYGDGYEQDSPRGINNNPEAWDIQFNGLDYATAIAIDDFLSAQNGQPFLWMNHKGIIKPYKCKTFAPNFDNNDVAQVTATFNEYFGTTV